MNIQNIFYHAEYGIKHMLLQSHCSLIILRLYPSVKL